MRDLFNLGDLSNYYAAEAHPALIDCRDWDNPRILSHGEIDRQVNACARALVASGLARGDRIAILSLNRAEVLVAYFAIMRAGFVAVPANIKFPRETIAFVLKMRRSICILRCELAARCCQADAPGRFRRHGLGWLCALP